MHPARLFIVCGPPGAVTTGRAMDLAERFGAVFLSVDGWTERLDPDVGDETFHDRIRHIHRELTTDLLRLGTNVVVESGTRTRAERDVLRESARRSGALVHLEFLDVESSDSVERPAPDELAADDPMPPVRAAERRGSASYPYGNWLPQSRPR